jgi:hypothetical protein
MKPCSDGRSRRQNLSARHARFFPNQLVTNGKRIEFFMIGMSLFASAGRHFRDSERGSA